MQLTLFDRPPDISTDLCPGANPRRAGRKTQPYVWCPKHRQDGRGITAPRHPFDQNAAGVNFRPLRTCRRMRLCARGAAADNCCNVDLDQSGMSALSFHGIQITEGRCVMAIQTRHHDHWMQHIAASVVCASRIGAALLIAGAALTFTSGQTEATPDKVTKTKPCGSCHPPNKPPKPR